MISGTNLRTLRSKTLKRIAALLIFALCAALCTAQSSNSNKSSTQLIELMDVMLEDFLNPQKPQNEPVTRPQASAAQKPVPQVVADPAQTLEPNPSVTTLPQTAKPSVDYSAVEPKPVAPVTTAPGSTSTPTHVTIEPASAPVAANPEPQPAPTVATNPEPAQPVQVAPAPAQPAQQEPATPAPTMKPVQTVVVEPKPAEPVQEEPLQANAELAQAPLDSDSSADELAQASLDSSTGDVVFDESMLEEDKGPGFEKGNYLTAFAEYNSYNTKFKTIGGSGMFEHVLRQNASVGVIGGVYIDWTKAYTKNGKKTKLALGNTVYTGELALFYRQYLMSAAMKEERPYPFGFYIEPELGIAIGYAQGGLIRDQLGLKPSPLIAMRAGYRLFIKKAPVYIEPFLRVGYPFVAGGGIGLGFRL